MFQVCRCFQWAVVFTILLLSSVAYGELLTIEFDGKQIELSRQDLKTYPQLSIDTRTPYNDGMNRYTGPSLKGVLRDVGASTETFKMRALNDYVVTVQPGELHDIDPIIALEMNGEPMSVRDKGPLWVMLPLSDQPRFNDVAYRRLLIWQLSEIEAESP